MNGGRGSAASFVEMEDELHEAAAQAVGFDDFGDPSYLEGLRVLLRAYDTESNFTEIGREGTRERLRSILEKRLRAERMWKQNPAWLQDEIKRPLVILGLVRTGSTALHYLLGHDPDLQSLEYWLAAQPQPRPPRSEWESHPDYQAAVAELDRMYAFDPALKSIHYMEAGLPEECRHLMEQAFTDDGFEVNAHVPSYSQWYQEADLSPSYRRHRDLIRTIGATNPERRWLFKYPVHMRYLDDFLDVYPDACIIQTHRDPTRVLPSYCSLIAGFNAIYEHEIDRREITLRQMELWAEGAEAAIEVREKRDPSQFFDLHFHDFVADPIGAVKRIYSAFDQELSGKGESCLRAWQTSNPQHRHGKHEYSAEDSGVAEAEILDRFAGYMEHFGVKAESSG